MAAGADHVIDRSQVDLVAALKEVVGTAGVDVVFDPVGGAAYDASTKVIAFEGRIVVVGFTSGTIPTPALGHALVKNYSIVGLHWGLYLQRDHAVADDAHAVLSRWAAAGAGAPGRLRAGAVRRGRRRADPARRRPDDRTRRGRAGRRDRLTSPRCGHQVAGRSTCARRSAHAAAHRRVVSGRVHRYWPVSCSSSASSRAAAPNAPCRMLPAAAATRALPTTGAMATRVPWASSSVMPASAARPRLIT